MTQTRVVNLREEGYDVYIGRGSKFGNPFKIGPDGNRRDVIEKYKELFYKQLDLRPEFKKDVESLRGKTLGCYCKPLACHGDVIVEYLLRL